MRDPSRQIDDGIPETVWMIEGQDGLEILQKKLLDEFLEERLQAVSDCSGVHDGSAYALEIGKDGAKAFGELIDLVSRFSQGKRHLPLLSVGDVGAELLHCLEIQTYRDDQAAEPLRDVPV